MRRALIIQTAFIGDVILATSLIENIKSEYPEISIDFVLRKGNESILANNPNINNIIIWSKKDNKYKGLAKVISEVRSTKYDLTINLQRFLSTGLITALSRGKIKLGFKKNPLSIFYSKRFEHEIGNGDHEIDRNHSLIKEYTNDIPRKPKIYPSQTDYLKLEEFQASPYITISPTSVWFTKQYPKSKWIEFIDEVPLKFKIYLLGSKDDHQYIEEICKSSESDKLHNLAGSLSLLQSAALMEKAVMNYVNDSAPLHLASATNSSVSAIFCSTVPAFGFGPLSDNSNIIEINSKLDCRPCGLHGKKTCPEKHFKCGFNINTKTLLNSLD